MCRQALILAMALVTLGACANPVPERYRGANAGSQGDSAALVFDGRGVTERLAFAEPGWELNRRDAEMSPRSIAAPNALDEWAIDARPSLDRTRRLQLRQDSRTIIYFNRQGPRTTPYYGIPYY